jgi:rRNA maturation endonuclease Nob1
VNSRRLYYLCGTVWINKENEVATFYDDNFGHYEIESQDDIDFYFEMQRKSVSKKCSGCGRRVKISPEYDYCNSCAEKMERGQELG